MNINKLKAIGIFIFTLELSSFLLALAIKDEKKTLHISRIIKRSKCNYIWLYNIYIRSIIFNVLHG